MNIYDLSVNKANGEQVSLSSYQWKVILIVNTATKCGLAPQFEELEALWQQYDHDKFVVLGFPCGQFANQEPWNNDEVQQTCKINFWVTFPLFAKLDVNGDNAHPLYRYLKSQKGGWFSDAIKWNFTKFLIDREGKVVARYSPTTKPSALKKDIEKLIWV